MRLEHGEIRRVADQRAQYADFGGIGLAGVDAALQRRQSEGSGRRAGHRACFAGAAVFDRLLQRGKLGVDLPGEAVNRAGDLVEVGAHRGKRRIQFLHAVGVGGSAGLAQCCDGIGGLLHLGVERVDPVRQRLHRRIVDRLAVRRDDGGARLDATDPIFQVGQAGFQGAGGRTAGLGHALGERIDLGLDVADAGDQRIARIRTEILHRLFEVGKLVGDGFRDFALGAADARFDAGDPAVDVPDAVGQLGVRSAGLRDIAHVVGGQIGAERKHRADDTGGDHAGAARGGQVGRLGRFGLGCPCFGGLGFACLGRCGFVSGSLVYQGTGFGTIGFSGYRFAGFRDCRRFAFGLRRGVFRRFRQVRGFRAGLRILRRFHGRVGCIRAGRFGLGDEFRLTFYDGRRNGLLAAGLPTACVLRTRIVLIVVAVAHAFRSRRYEPPLTHGSSRFYTRFAPSVARRSVSVSQTTF